MVKHVVLAAVLLQGVLPSGAQNGAISGRVLAAGNVPAANVRVAAIAFRDNQQPVAVTGTDGEGRYRLENLPPGGYYIAVGAISPAYFPGVADQSNAAVVTVAGGSAIAGLDFAVPLTLAQLQSAPPQPAANPIPRGARGGPAQLQITVFDRQGKLVGTVPDFLPAGVISISPDGTRVAVARSGNIWTLEIATGKSTQVTSDPAAESNPAWSPDGKRIAYFSSRSPAAGVYVRSADGTGAEELLYGQIGIGLAWSTDRFLSMVIGTDVWALPTTGERKPMQILRSNAIGPRFSLDGRFVAYSFNRTEVFVRPFDGAAGDPTPADKEKKISVQGGVGLVRWRADGAELYYLTPNGGVMAVPISSTPEFVAGAPALLFQAPSSFSVTGNPGQLSDISADGQRFVFLLPVPANNSAPAPPSATPVR